MVNKIEINPHHYIKKLTRKLFPFFCYLILFTISKNGWGQSDVGKQQNDFYNNRFKIILEQKEKKEKFRSDSKSKINMLSRTIASTLEDKKVINLRLEEILIKIPKNQ
jgi:hypothetical protein